MKTSIKPMMVLSAMLLFPLAARANDIAPSQEFYTAHPTPSPVVLDGNLGEWDFSNAIVDPVFSTPKGSGAGGTYGTFETLGGDWTGAEDFSSQVMLSWDGDNVYLGVLVIDEYHENAANSGWNGDSLQLMVANGDRNAQIGLYNYALGGVENSLGGTVIMTEAGPGGTEAVVSRVGIATSYEIKLPLGALGLSSMEVGTQIGIGMAINDGDELTPGQKGWGGWGPHALVFGKSPQETGLVTLGVPEPSTIGLSLLALGSLMLRGRRR